METNNDQSNSFMLGMIVGMIIVVGAILAITALNKLIPAIVNDLGPVCPTTALEAENRFGGGTWVQGEYGWLLIADASTSVTIPAGFGYTFKFNSDDPAGIPFVLGLGADQSQNLNPGNSVEVICPL